MATRRAGAEDGCRAFEDAEYARGAGSCQVVRVAVGLESKAEPRHEAHGVGVVRVDPVDDAVDAQAMEALGDQGRARLSRVASLPVGSPKREGQFHVDTVGVTRDGASAVEEDDTRLVTVSLEPHQAEQDFAFLEDDGPEAELANFSDKARCKSLACPSCSYFIVLRLTEAWPVIRLPTNREPFPRSAHLVLILSDAPVECRVSYPQAFLRGCGVPETLIEYLPAIVRATQPIRFYTCFISYSSKNRDFAERPHGDLRARGVRTWYDREDLKIGD